MDLQKKLFMTFAALFATFHCDAVSLSSKGHGEVLIYPYYTVNNNMNTVYSVVNTTDQAKAVKIRFLEGEAGMEVLEFNVYLSAFDVWTGVLGSTTSTLAGHVGEPSVMHITSDTSCAPFLNKSGQEFVPYVIETDAPNNSLQRVTDGHIEVLEMGVVTDDQFNSATAIAHAIDGIPNDCTQILNAWNFGYWFSDSTADMDIPTGGISGSASLLNVTDGLEFSFNAVALDDFWQGSIAHTEPGSLIPNLSSAVPESKILLNNSIQTSTWNTGIEAVSAVLMYTEIYNEYAFDAAAVGKSEWVVTFPTKFLHTVNVSSAMPPFDQTWNGEQACEEFSILVFDRESQIDPPGNTQITPQPPAGANPSMCYHTNVIEFISGGLPPATTSSIFGADNLLTVEGVDSAIATENGWAAVAFYSLSQNMTPISGSGYMGLPAVGFQVQQLTNNSAQPGLIAQYGRLFEHKGVSFNF
ncbi:MAG: hypothetical protein ACSHWU_03950 [Marinicella sp.]